MRKIRVISLAWAHTSKCDTKELVLLSFKYVCVWGRGHGRGEKSPLLCVQIPIILQLVKEPWKQFKSFCSFRRCWDAEKDLITFFFVDTAPEICKVYSQNKKMCISSWCSSLILKHPSPPKLAELILWSDPDSDSPLQNWVSAEVK